MTQSLMRVKWKWLLLRYFSRFVPNYNLFFQTCFPKAFIRGFVKNVKFFHSVNFFRYFRFLDVSIAKTKNLVMWLVNSPDVVLLNSC